MAKLSSQFQFLYVLAVLLNVLVAVSHVVSQPDPLGLVPHLHHVHQVPRDSLIIGLNPVNSHEHLKRKY